MNIIIFVNIRNDSIKYNHWHDGFTKAIGILQKKYNIEICNVYDNPKIDFNNYDWVFFKESFTGNMYKKYESLLVKKNRVGLFISSSNTIPNISQLKKYDLLFYETYWYHNYAKLNRHKNVYHAFGIDTTVMKPLICEKKYDVIFVGTISPHKRPLNILKMTGKKICLGFKTNKHLVSKLESNNVVVKDFIHYENLAKYYNESKLCYIPCILHGGGERAVLEARSCGIPVKIENDNFKLKELCNSTIYTAEYYANQIELGLNYNLN
jgi:glycosyltransferase involved in cell wall biosynthesis